MTTQPSGEEPPRPPRFRQPWGISRPPSDQPPSGPPSGPLSGGGGGSGPPPPPPSGPPSGPGAPPPKGPWWRSVPRLAAAVVAVAAVAALVVVLTRPGGTPSGKAGGEVFLQPVSATGPAPFTESSATDQGTPSPQTPSPQAPSTAPSGTANGTTVTRSVSGAAPGLYGGTKDVASCDVEKQIKLLTAEPAKNAAFASALAVKPAAVPDYLRSLTPLQLRADTRVTNHGYRDGKPIAYQAVLQAGTAVLVDDRGVPRVRCACGNPLAPPVALRGGEPKRTGQPWPSYRPSQVVVIAPSVTVVNKFVIYDHHDGSWVERDRNDHQGKHDKTVPPPAVEKPPPSSRPPTVSPPASPPQSPALPPESPLSPPVSPPSSPPTSPDTSPASPPEPDHPGSHTSHPALVGPHTSPPTPNTESPGTATPSSASPGTATPGTSTPSTASPGHGAPGEPANPGPSVSPAAYHPTGPDTPPPAAYDPPTGNDR